MRAHRVDPRQVAFDQQRFLGVVGGAGQDVAVGIADERSAQNSMPPSKPVRLTAATNRPLAIAWLRIIVSQAACWLAPYSCFSACSQPMAVG